MASMFYKFFDKNAWDTNSQTRNGISENQELAKELRKPINRKLKKIYIYILLLELKLGALIFQTCNCKCKVTKK